MSFTVESLLPPSFWDEYKGILDQAHNTFDQKLITLRRFVKVPSRFKEDDNLTPQDVELQSLLNYNYMRTWPITYPTETGELDRQSIQVFLNKNYLRENNLLTPHGNLDYDPAKDRFIVDGLIYKPMGDTPAAQAGSDDMFFTVIIKREENSTGDTQIR